METHLVHYNSKYTNFTEALRHKDGLVVIALFIQAKKNAKNIPFSKFSDEIPNIIEPKSKSSIVFGNSYNVFIDLIYKFFDKMINKFISFETKLLLAVFVILVFFFEFLIKRTHFHFRCVALDVRTRVGKELFCVQRIIDNRDV